MADVDQFLQNIAHIESNNGRNTNHPVIQHGIHKGMSAIGTYGLMPLTVQEIAGGSSDPQVRQLLKYSPYELKSIVESNPVLERKLAESLANKVLINHNGDEAKAAYSWNQGSNLKSDDISPVKLVSSPYVQKYNQVKMQSNQNSNPQIVALQKLAQNDVSNNQEQSDQNKPSPEDLINYVHNLQSEAMAEPEEMNLRKDINSDESTDDSDKPDDDSDYSAKLAALMKMSR
jgi:hypothetical protein